jgi:hypothetical protein
VRDGVGVRLRLLLDRLVRGDRLFRDRRRRWFGGGGDDRLG